MADYNTEITRYTIFWTITDSKEMTRHKIFWTLFQSEKCKVQTMN
jgi:hypothetical protein